MDLEIEFYTEIIDEYTDCCSSEEDTFLWFCFAIIKLMRLTKNNKDSDLVRNGLILILEHYQCVEEHLLDMQYLDENEVVNSNKDFLLTALKEEFA